MDTFNIDMTLDVTGGADLAAHFELVVDHYYQLEAGDDALLDCSFGFSATGEGRALVEVELTVCGDTGDAAYAKGTSAVRTAIHAAGGSTPSWDEPPTTDVQYVFTDAGEPEPIEDGVCV